MRLDSLYRITLLAVMCLLVLSAFASVAHAQTTDVDTALESFRKFLQGIVKWLLGPGRLLIALAWLVIGFKTLLNPSHSGGAGGFVFVALVGLAIVLAPQILGALGIDIQSLL